ncbi:hypothetical protein ACFL2K_01945 [Candidatus Margulisiibacteriota bacterium]
MKMQVYFIIACIFIFAAFPIFPNKFSVNYNLNNLIDADKAKLNAGNNSINYRYNLNYGLIKDIRINSINKSTELIYQAEYLVSLKSNQQLIGLGTKLSHAKLNLDLDVFLHQDNIKQYDLKANFKLIPVKNLVFGVKIENVKNNWDINFQDNNNDESETYSLNIPGSKYYFSWENNKNLKIRANTYFYRIDALISKDTFSADLKTKLTIMQGGLTYNNLDLSYSNLNLPGSVFAYSGSYNVGLLSNSPFYEFNVSAQVYEIALKQDIFGFKTNFGYSFLDLAGEIDEFRVFVIKKHMNTYSLDLKSAQLLSIEIKKDLRINKNMIFSFKARQTIPIKLTYKSTDSTSAEALFSDIGESLKVNWGGLLFRMGLIILI